MRRIELQNYKTLDRESDRLASYFLSSMELLTKSSARLDKLHAMASRSVPAEISPRDAENSVLQKLTVHSVSDIVHVYGPCDAHVYTELLNLEHMSCQQYG